MLREAGRTKAIVGLAGVSGYVGWSGLLMLLPVALAFAVLWSIAPNRRAATLVSAAYFLSASRGLPQGVAAFYQADLWPGLLLWLLASMGFVAVHALLWTGNPTKRPACYLAACLLTAFPPFGITGWAHPITAAGVVFAGCGWWGLAAMTAGLMGLVTHIRPAVAIVLAGFWLWSAAVWTEPVIPNAWMGVDLDLGASLGRDHSLARQRDLIATVQTQGVGEIQTVVLPESAIGNWTPTVERLWAEGLKGSSVTAIAGASVFKAEGYDNVLIAISRDGGRIIYRQRMPVPGSMWQPWRSWFGEPRGIQARFFANPVVDLAGQKLAPLICYEQLIVWPILQSMLHDPDVVVAAGNGWWAANTSIVPIQRASVTAWARLFGKPLVLSFNI